MQNQLEIEHLLLLLDETVLEIVVIVVVLSEVVAKVTFVAKTAAGQLLLALKARVVGFCGIQP